MRLVFSVFTSKPDFVNSFCSFLQTNFLHICCIFAWLKLTWIKLLRFDRLTGMLSKKCCRDFCGLCRASSSSCPLCQYSS